MLDTKATILEYHKQEGDAQASVTPWQVLCFAFLLENDSVLEPPSGRPPNDRLHLLHGRMTSVS